MKHETPRNVKDALSQSYEALRDFAVDHKMAPAVPRGLALFLRRGMPGWMETWTKPVSSDQVIAVKSPVLEIGCRESAPSLPLEATAILANMALVVTRRNSP